MPVNKTLSKAFNVALIVASFGLVGGITAGVFSAGDRQGVEVADSEKPPVKAASPSPYPHPHP